uniref:Lysozyme n=1 Tax=Noctiluca scintillans TaxID=2966 RepID=A0A7S1AKY3_NOCSC|mmetsp:Transcript_50603/g.134707  ORF Transcript_50603/g.134707 Transcript_50603/m.134707 type:complete len:236 (+) Transcript_50603:50-757(+)
MFSRLLLVLIIGTPVTEALEANVSLPETHLRGIDVSHYQGTINWNSVKSSGVSFAMAKATEGTSYTDPMFNTNWNGMHSAGLVRGAYHFARPGSDAVTQADHFVNTVNNAGGITSGNTLQLVLDLETTDGLGSAAVLSWVEAFMARVKSLTGRPGIIYTGYYFWNDDVRGSSCLDAPLWIAAYSSSPSIPSPWGGVGWAFWQYSDSGSVSGISGAVDLDYFQNGGSYPDIYNLCF